MSNKNQIESEFNKLNISDRDFNPVNISHENCYKPNYPDYKPWCKECVPHCITEGWTSENAEIDEFIKNTIYNAKMIEVKEGDYYYDSPLFLEWVPFDRFEDMKQIGEGGFAKVYSATWIGGNAKYFKQDDGSWKKLDPEPIKITLKRLNGSQNISAEYINEVYFTNVLFIS